MVSAEGAIIFPSAKSGLLGRPDNPRAFVSTADFERVPSYALGLDKDSFLPVETAWWVG